MSRGLLVDPPSVRTGWKCLDYDSDIEGPGPRGGHSAVVHEGCVYIFGGANVHRELLAGREPQHTRLNELWCYDTASYSWTNYTTLPNQPCPSKRYDHTAVVVGKRMYVFGGSKMNNFFNDLWCYDFEVHRWHEVLPPAPSTGQSVGWRAWPAQRSVHSAVVHGRYMYIFGGHCMGHFLNDLWRFDTATNTWSEIQLEGGEGAWPIPRSDHSAVVDKDRMYVMGGVLGSTGTNEVWEYNFGTRKWRQLDNIHTTSSFVASSNNNEEESDSTEDEELFGKVLPKRGGPDRRHYHAACVYGGSMYVFGGYHRGSMNDFWRLSLDELVWEQLTPPANTTWPDRCEGHSLVTAGSRLILFGGCNYQGKYLNRLWEYECLPDALPMGINDYGGDITLTSRDGLYVATTHMFLLELRCPAVLEVLKNGTKLSSGALRVLVQYSQGRFPSVQGVTLLDLLELYQLTARTWVPLADLCQGLMVGKVGNSVTRAKEAVQAMTQYGPPPPKLLGHCTRIAALYETTQNPKTSQHQQQQQHQQHQQHQQNAYAVAAAAVAGFSSEPPGLFAFMGTLFPQSVAGLFSAHNGGGNLVTGYGTNGDLPIMAPNGQPPRSQEEISSLLSLLRFDPTSSQAIQAVGQCLTPPGSESMLVDGNGIIGGGRCNANIAHNNNNNGGGNINSQTNAFSMQSMKRHPIATSASSHPSNWVANQNSQESGEEKLGWGAVVSEVEGGFNTVQANFKRDMLLLARATFYGEDIGLPDRTDCTVVYDDVTFRAHKAVLASTSGFFRRAFYPTMPTQESTASTVRVHRNVCDSAEGLRSLLAYCYVGDAAVFSLNSLVSIGPSLSYFSLEEDMWLTSYFEKVYIYYCEDMEEEGEVECSNITAQPMDLTVSGHGAM